MPAITILITDDHVLVRQSLVQFGAMRGGHGHSAGIGCHLIPDFFYEQNFLSGRKSADFGGEGGVHGDKLGGVATVGNRTARLGRMAVFVEGVGRRQ